MNINGKTITVTSIFAAFAAPIAVLKFMGVGWTDVAWKTQTNHAEDLIELRAELVTEIQRVEADAVGATQEFYENWKCDEAHEELIDLLKEQQAGDTSVETEERIKQLRTKLDKLNCDRFDN